MAFFRARFGIVARSQGGSAGARSAYQNCRDYGAERWSEKADEFVHSEVMLPDGAPGDFADATVLWEAVEAGEKRKDAQISRTFDIAIPHEVPEHLRNDFARDILRPYIEDYGFALEWTRHKADHVFSAEDPAELRHLTENDHIHVQMTMRPLGLDGFGKKDRDFNIKMKTGNGRDERERIADRMNAFFDRNGIDARVNPGPKAQGELHLPTASKAVIRMYQHWQRQNLKAGAEGRPALGQPRAVREFLAARKEAVSMLLLNKKLTARIATLEAREKDRKHAALAEEERTTRASASAASDRKTRMDSEGTQEDDRRRSSPRDRGNSRDGQAHERARVRPDEPARTSEGRSASRRGDSGGPPAGNHAVASSSIRAHDNARKQPSGAHLNLQSSRRAVAQRRQRQAALRCAAFVPMLQESRLPPADFPSLDASGGDAAAFLKRWAQTTKLGLHT